jgi:hypothetical protein
MVGRRDHMLCYTQQEGPYSFVDKDLIILALDTKSAHATIIEQPQELLGSLKSRSSNLAETLIVATTATTMQGKRWLSLWLRRHLWYRCGCLCRQLVSTGGEPKEGHWQAVNPVMFIWGEWNFWMERIGLVQLNLGTEKALVLLRNNGQQRTSQALLYEINLIYVPRYIFQKRVVGVWLCVCDTRSPFVFVLFYIWHSAMASMCVDGSTPI